MKLKSLLFGSAALLAAGTGAQAADLPIAEPVEYVRICDAFGVGFFYIPGTDTCLRISGRVRVESHFVDGDINTPFADAAFAPGAFAPGGIPAGVPAGFVLGFPETYVDEEREFNNWTSRARGNVRLDARTQTDFGLVRAFIEYQMTVGPSDFAQNYSAASPDLVHAYIQVTNDWGTYTAGHTSSFFDFWGSNTFGTRVSIDDPTGENTLFGWTFGFGNGFSATVAVEDPASAGDRKNPTMGILTFPTLVFGAGPFAGDPLAFVFTPGFDSYEGQEAPDLVLNLRVDQGWGSAQVMGALHHIHDKENFEFILPGLGFPDEGAPDADALGWAVGAGLSLNLPFFGLTFNSQGAYSEGALSYVTSDPASKGYFTGFNSGDFIGFDADGSETEAWSVRAGINGDFTPTVGFSLDGSYTEVETDTVDGAFAVGAVVLPVEFSGQDYEHYAIVGNIHWNPVPGLLFGWEAGWNHLELNHTALEIAQFSTGTSTDDEFDVFGAMFRVQRDF